MKEVICRLYKQEMDQKKILKHLSDRYKFKISLNMDTYTISSKIVKLQHPLPAAPASINLLQPPTHVLQLHSTYFSI